jgi:nucleotide-binding universal stress UspA family protein
MLKDIVVSVGLAEDASYAAHYAVSVAAALDAHLTAVAFIYEPYGAETPSFYVPAAALIADQERQSEQAAKAALDRFAAAAARSGVTVEPIALPASYAGAATQFGLIARRFDLAIVGQGERDKGAIEKQIAGDALFDSGRPVIVVPYIQKAPLALNRVMVCWDGSRPSARAVGDAMPLLERAKLIEVVTVANEPGKQDEIEGADIGRHLARHGLKVDVRRIAGGDIDVADALLSHAADVSANFIVMGGYGHSRMREFVLGGVTRTFLATMTAPTLMAH